MNFAAIFGKITRTLKVMVYTVKVKRNLSPSNIGRQSKLKYCSTKIQVLYFCDVVCLVEDQHYVRGGRRNLEQCNDGYMSDFPVFSKQMTMYTYTVGDKKILLLTKKRLNFVTYLKDHTGVHGRRNEVCKAGTMSAGLS